MLSFPDGSNRALLFGCDHLSELTGLSLSAVFLFIKQLLDGAIFTVFVDNSALQTMVLVLELI